jgi:DNA-binding CsgD family transcriptional regulator
LGSPSEDVLGLHARAALKVAHQVGISTSALLQDQSLTEEKLLKAKWLSWDEFAAFSARLEAELTALGLGADFGNLLLPHFPLVSALVGIFVGPMELYRCLFELGKSAFRNSDQSLRIVDSCVVQTHSLRPHDSDGRAFFRLSLSALTQIPRAVGLQPAKVRADISSHQATYFITPPHLPNWRDRLRSGLEGITEEVVEQLAELKQPSLPMPERQPILAEGPLPWNDGRLERIATKWQLTGRQREVLGYLVHGKTNLEVGKILNCSDRTVEIHIRQIFRRVSVSTRTELTARFWMEL